MTREKTARWIPNAIQISTNTEKVSARAQNMGPFQGYVREMEM